MGVWLGRVGLEGGREWEGVGNLLNKRLSYTILNIGEKGDSNKGERMLRTCGLGLGAVSRGGLRANCFALAKLAVRRDYRLLAFDNTDKAENNRPNSK